MAKASKHGAQCEERRTRKERIVFFLHAMDGVFILRPRPRKNAPPQLATGASSSPARRCSAPPSGSPGSRPRILSGEGAQLGWMRKTQKKKEREITWSHFETEKNSPSRLKKNTTPPPSSSSSSQRHLLRGRRHLRRHRRHHPADENRIRRQETGRCLAAVRLHVRLRAARGGPDDGLGQPRVWALRGRGGVLGGAVGRGELDAVRQDPGGGDLRVRAGVVRGASSVVMFFPPPFSHPPFSPSFFGFFSKSTKQTSTSSFISFFFCSLS